MYITYLWRAAARAPHPAHHDGGARARGAALAVPALVRRRAHRQHVLRRTLPHWRRLLLPGIAY